MNEKIEEYLKLPISEIEKKVFSSVGPNILIVFILFVRLESTIAVEMIIAGLKLLIINVFLFFLLQNLFGTMLITLK